MKGDEASRQPLLSAHLEGHPLQGVHGLGGALCWDHARVGLVGPDAGREQAEHRMESISWIYTAFRRNRRNVLRAARSAFRAVQAAPAPRTRVKALRAL